MNAIAKTGKAFQPRSNSTAEATPANETRKTSQPEQDLTGVLKAKGSEVVEAIQSMAQQGRYVLQEKIEAQKGVGADYVGNLAQTTRKAAKLFEANAPMMARYVSKAADGIEDVANALKNGSVKDLVRQASSFARRQPSSFLTLTSLAAFAGLRLLKGGSVRRRPLSGDGEFPQSSGSDHF